MNLLNKPTKIEEPLSLIFNTAGGWYLFIISARVKSAKQRGSRETNDEDLTAKIDGKTFPHPSRPGRLKDSPAAFSGGQLHNKLKTVCLITHLVSGEHQLVLIPQYGAEVVEVSYERIEFDGSKITSPVERQAEEAHGRSWITFVLDSLDLKSLTAEATVDWYFPDGDDVKLIVDGKIKKNERSVLHKNWVWSSNILHKFFGGATQVKTFEENLPKGLHYVEFHADESPTLHYVSFDVGKAPLLRAKVVVDEANLRESALPVSTTLKALEENTVVEILQKAIEGEAPYKDRGSFTDTWHKVLFEEKEGYIFSEALEIDGEDQQSIRERIAKKAESFSLNPQIALGLSWCESNLFPYKVSETKAKGLFQLSPELITDLNDEKMPFYNPIRDPFDIEENISGGLSYFKWLYEQHRTDPQQLEKAIVAYNTGPGGVPAGRLELSLYQQQTQRLVACVKSYQE